MRSLGRPFASLMLASTLCACLLVLLLLPSTTHAQSKHLRGIRKRDIGRYTGATFNCFDGSGTFSAEHVNDDYCDCADSSDEPGTSACPSSSFFCSNKGATSLTLPSSRVNDLICDCCDGSDEWEGKKEGGCPNTCAELGRALHQHVLDEIAATDAGVKLRQQAIEESQRLKAEKEAKKATYEAKLATRLQALEAAKAAQATEEAVEKAEKDRLKAIEDAIAAEKAAIEASQHKDEPPLLHLDQQTEQETAVVPPDQQQEAGPPLGNTETPAEAQPEAPAAENFPYPAEYAFKPEDVPATPPPPAEPEVVQQEIESFPYPAEYAYHAETPQPDPLEQEDDMPPPGMAGVRPPPAEGLPVLDEPVAAEATPDAAPEAPPAITSDTYRLEGEQKTPQTSSGGWGGWVPEWVGEAREGVREAMEPVAGLAEEVLEFYAQCWAAAREAVWPSPLTPAQAAEKAREVTRAAQAAVDRSNSKIATLNTWLTSDFGPELEFAAFEGKCFQLNEKQYVYEMCPYGQAAQKEGGQSTSLGSWDGLKVREDGTRVLSFANGQTCWNGPARSLQVLMRCGVEQVIKDVQEPSRCVYEMTFTTPAVCNAEKAKQLQQELDDQMGADEE